MAPPAKAVKSDISLKVYNHTRDIRRVLDSYDKVALKGNVMLLNDAVCEARKLVKYLESKVNDEISLEGGTSRLHDVAA